MGKNDTQYALDDLLIARMAKEFKGDEIVGAGGTLLSAISAVLAKNTHAPDMIISGGSLNLFDSSFMPTLGISEFIGVDKAKANLTWIELFDIIFHKKFLIWVGAAQLDRFGSANISLIGEWHKPKAMLVGARGLPDDGVQNEKMMYHVMKHSKNTFVEKVDFVCSAGFTAKREEMGIDRGQPAVVVSNLGVFDFDEEKRTMRIQSLHPGVALEQVVKNTGFELVIPEDIPETEPPTAEELEIINRIDPLGIRKLERADPEQKNKLVLEIMKNEREYIENRAF